jgi:Amt family ammonium transporter
VLAPGFLTTPSAAELLGGREGLVYGGGATQLGWQLVALFSIAAFTFVTAWAAFSLIDRTIGLRAPEDAELQGLDIVEHGMYGYPERFIEVPGATPDDALPELAGAPAGAATARAWEGGS